MLLDTLTVPRSILSLGVFFYLIFQITISILCSIQPTVYFLPAYSLFQILYSSFQTLFFMVSTFFFILLSTLIIIVLDFISDKLHASISFSFFSWKVLLFFHLGHVSWSPCFGCLFVFVSVLERSTLIPILVGYVPPNVLWVPVVPSP